LINQSFWTDLIYRYHFAVVNFAELALYYNKLASNFAFNDLAFCERHFLVSGLGFVLARVIRLPCLKYIIGLDCGNT